jgi:hypothetical protein
MENFPFEIIKVICDYLVVEDVIDVVDNISDGKDKEKTEKLDYLPHVEKFFRKDVLKSRVLFEKYNVCKCTMKEVKEVKEDKCGHVWSQNNNPDHFYYFVFHPNYSERFLEQMMDTYFPHLIPHPSLNKLGQRSSIKVPIDSRKKLTKFFSQKYSRTNKPCAFLSYYDSFPQSARENLNCGLRVFFDTNEHEEKKEDKFIYTFRPTTDKDRIEWKMDFPRNHDKYVDKEHHFLDKYFGNLSEDLVEKTINDKFQNALLAIPPVQQPAQWKKRMWNYVAKNKKTSVQFIFHHLENKNISGEEALHNLSQHPSFEYYWKSYLLFFSLEMIDRVFKTPEKRCVNEDFFVRFPQYLKYNLSNQNLTANFLRRFAADHANSSNGVDYFDISNGFFLPPTPSRFIGNKVANRFTIFENTSVGTEFIEELLVSRLTSPTMPLMTEEHKNEIVQVLNANHSLSESFWENHKEWIYWGTEKRFQNPSVLLKQLDNDRDVHGVKLSEFVVLKYMETNISCNPNLSIAFIKKYKDKLNLSHVLKYNNELPNYFFRQAMAKFIENMFSRKVELKTKLESKEEKQPLTFVQKLKKFKTETIKVWEKLNTVNVSQATMKNRVIKF